MTVNLLSNLTFPGGLKKDGDDGDFVVLVGNEKEDEDELYFRVSASEILLGKNELFVIHIKEKEY